MLVAVLCPIRPLWTDEVLQLIGTRNLAGTNLLNFIRDMPGQAPLGYLLQHYTIHWIGYSVISARLVPVAFAIAALIVVVLICRELRHPGAGVGLLMWIALPLVLRYATEARPYSLALFFSALATLFLLRLIREPSTTQAILYGLAVVGGAYSMPYTLFPQIGFVAFLFAKHNDDASPWKLNRARLYAALSLILAGAIFAPWAVSAVGKWHNAVEVGQLTFDLSPKFPLLLVQEVSGGGYACSLPLLFLAIAGYRSPLLDTRVKRLLLCGIAASVSMVLILDAGFHYYFAIRQILFVLIPLVLFAGAGAAWLLRQRTVLAMLVLSVFLMGAAVRNVAQYADRSSDWAPAARALKADLNAGYCLAMTPGTTPAFFAFFEPSLNHLDCNDWKGSNRAVFPVTAYTSTADLKKMEEEFKSLNFQKQWIQEVGNTRFLLYERTPATGGAFLLRCPQSVS